MVFNDDYSLIASVPRAYGGMTSFCYKVKGQAAAETFYNRMKTNKSAQFDDELGMNEEGDMVPWASKYDTTCALQGYTAGGKVRQDGVTVYKK